MDRVKQTVSADRKSVVTSKLTTLLEELRRDKPYLHEVATGHHYQKDVCSLYIEGKVEEIRQLKKRVGGYDNPGQHFTKQHRSMEGHCVKLQLDLDQVDVVGRNDLETTRKAALLEVENLIEELSKKVHTGGQLCKNCESLKNN